MTLLPFSPRLSRRKHWFRRLVWRVGLRLWLTARGPTQPTLCPPHPKTPPTLHARYRQQNQADAQPLLGQLQEVERQIQAIGEFTECDKVTGEDCFIARLHVRSMEQLDTLLDRLNHYAETNTAIIKKTPVKRRLPPME